MSSKLNWLLENTQPGALVLQSWLTANGISPQLAARYRESNWLNKLRPGVYARPGRHPEWQDAVYCLATQLEVPVHLAGLTSLVYQGKAHYVKQDENSIWLHIPTKTTLPNWFKEYPDNNSNQPDFKWNIVSGNKLKEVNESDLITVDVNGQKLNASNQELAALELLHVVPTLISFEHAAEVFQSLVNLSPKRVQSLLSRSNAIGTNRIFLFLAHFYNHPWVSRLDEAVVNLGAGKRKVVENGLFDSSYQITVPRKFIISQQEEAHQG